MDIQRLIKSLKEKGISVIANSNGVVAGLIWGVEGVEKVPKLGDVLFYIVNGTRYGVKPKRGNKHDIDWYYKQLKMGMQGAKAYHTGLTQFLNTWIKKGELEVVFKGKATASASVNEDGIIDKVSLTAISNYLEQNNIEFDLKQNGRIYTFSFDCGKIILDGNNQKAKAFFDGKVKEAETMRELNDFFSKCKVVASVHISEEAIDNILLEEMNLNADKKKEGDSIIAWTIKAGNRPIAVIRINNVTNLAKIDTPYGKTLISTISSDEELRKSIHKLISEKTVASPQLVSETGIANLLHDMHLKAVKDNNPLHGSIWCFKNAEIRYKDGDDLAYIFLKNDFGSHKLNAECRTMDDVRNYITKHLNQFKKYNKVTGASPRKYRPSIRERMNRDSYLDPMDFSITERKDVEAFNKFKKEVQSIELFGRTPFNAFAYLADKPEDLKKAKAGHNYIENINLEFRNGFIQVKCSEVEMDRLDEVLSNLNEKYKFKVLNYVGNGKFEFSPSFGGNQILYVLKPDELDYTVKNLRTECKLIEKVTSPFYIEEIVASVKLTEGVIDNVLLHELNLNADKKKEGDFTVWTLKAGKRDLANVKLNNITGLTRIETVYGKVLAHTITTDAEFRDTIHKLISEKAIANSNDNRDSIIKEFIDKVNNLKVRGMKAFNASKHNNGISIQLLLPRFKTEDMNKLTSVVEDKLSIIFPITQKWMDADKGRTFGNLAKVGDIVLYTDEWSSQEFSNELNIDFRDSKFDNDDIKGELDALYEQLESDCKELNNPNLKFVVTVTAKTVTVNVKETAEVNEENFEGINEEHDRLLYTKVSPEKFLNLWKTSKNFNGSQIQKIIYGFKLASRTLGSKFENKGILIEYFYSKKYGKGYIRVEYEKDLFIIYVAQSEDNGDIKVITRKMRKMIPTKNFNILSTSVNSLAFERAALPTGFKPVWEEVTQSN